MLANYDAALERWPEPPDVAAERAIYVTLLTNRANALIELGRLEEALATCRQAVDVRPDSALAAYNLSGVYALLGHRDEALEWLGRNVDLGDRDWRWLIQDDWFAALRNDPDFVALVQRMKRE